MKYLIIFPLLSCVWAASLHKDFRRIVPRLSDTRIVGGTPCTEYKYPHQVSLRYKNILTPENSYAHRCGGSILLDNVIITAAHCIISTVPSQHKIVAGTRNRRGGDGYIVPVQDIIMHENYQPDNYDNDVALLILGAPLPLNNVTMKAIELATQDPLAGASATVTGWGTTSSGGLAADILQEVKVPIVSNEVCNQDYDGAITDAMLCAGIRGVGGKDACQGDSGGPLIANGKLIGVVSWGYGCARPEYPGVYSKVSYLRPWILKKVQEINGKYKSFQ